MTAYCLQVLGFLVFDSGGVSLVTDALFVSLAHNYSKDKEKSFYSEELILYFHTFQPYGQVDIHNKQSVVGKFCFIQKLFNLNP